MGWGVPRVRTGDVGDSFLPGAGSLGDVVGGLVENEKLRFVAAWKMGETIVTALCASFGVSRQAGYELLRRDRAEGAGDDRSSGQVILHVPSFGGARISRSSFGPGTAPSAS
jgi:hypothetical protein